MTTPNFSFRVVWTKTAEADLDSIIDFIADDSIDAALAVFTRIRERAATLHHFPNKGRVVPELLQHGIVQYRELILSPWRIMYRIDGSVVYVTAVFDSRRNLEDLLLERLTRG
ncbi:MAG: type II toxin-antitoxin system RelE/ParE family toxin [Desulfuromonadaceae bacterium]